MNLHRNSIPLVWFLINLTAFLFRCSYQFQVQKYQVRRPVPQAALAPSPARRKSDRFQESLANCFSLYMSFFDKFKEAFENDPGDYEAIVGEGESPPPKRIPMTEVQKRWMDSSSGKGKSTGIVNAPISSNVLSGTTWSLELYLSGIPDRDPSNNLYGSRVNISSRDNRLGLGVTCPEDPSITIQIEFDNNGVCRAQKSPFTTGVDGQYKLQENGNMIRFSLDTSGFTRTVQTTGTITKVFWSEDNEVTSKTQSTYSIPPGYLYADSKVRFGRIPGTLEMEEGILRVEQTSGLFGALTKMVACGKFKAHFVPTEDT